MKLPFIMFLNKPLRRIRQLREEPEETRLHAASILTIYIGLVIIFIILIVLLPLQLFFS